MARYTDCQDCGHNKTRHGSREGNRCKAEPYCLCGGYTTNAYIGDRQRNLRTVGGNIRF